MQRYPNGMAQAAASSGPKWVPIQKDWPWIAGTVTVAALAAGLIYLGNKKK